MTEASTSVESVRSADGTSIAYERHGNGPALVIVGGAFNDRGTVRDLATVLAPFFSAYVYDRRGRGDSDDSPSSVEREIEDLEAVMAAAGDDVFLFGHSSGAALCVLAAAQSSAIGRLAVYEPPYGNGQPAQLRARVLELLEAGNRTDAVRTFLLDAVGLPEQIIPMIESSPDWPAMEAIAHTLPNDLAILGDGTVPAEAASISIPTLVIHGTQSPPWAVPAATDLSAAVPDAELLAIEGEDHAILQRPATLVPVLTEFFGAA